MDTHEIMELARLSHEGRRDDFGRDYFTGYLTPIATGAELFGESAVQVAWLSGILNVMSADELKDKGVTGDVIRTVEAVTKRDDETHEQSIHRAAVNPVGRVVKLVQNAWDILNRDLRAQEGNEEATRMLNDQDL